MDHEPAGAIAAYKALDPASCQRLSDFRIRQLRDHTLDLVIETTSDRSDRTITAAFRDVRDLRIDWPTWSVVKVGVLHVDDVSSDGLESVRYRVSHPEDLIAFWCHSFEPRGASRTEV